MGIGDDSTAARRLRLLQRELLDPERQVERIHTNCGARCCTSPRAAHPGSPLNIAAVDYFGAAVQEVVSHTRAAVPEAGPLPAEAADIYGWMREHTAHLDDHRQTAGEQIVYRQSLEHAIAMGDDKVVRRHPCPACGCYGLFWQQARRAAVCVNHLCTDDDGVSRAWPLKRLAREHIASQKMLKKRAT
jgi:hypothetical protein